MTSYDYGSVMHYEANAFAINRSAPTIIPTQNSSAYIGQRIQLSSIEILEIQRYYNCVSTPTSTTSTTMIATTTTTTSATTTTATTTTTTSATTTTATTTTSATTTTATTTTTTTANTTIVTTVTVPSGSMGVHCTFQSYFEICFMFWTCVIRFYSHAP